MSRVGTPNSTASSRAGYGCPVREAFFSLAADATDYHLPVFPRETLEWLGAGPGRLFIDGTLGGGGHSELLLESGARVIGVDRDPEALAHAGRRLARFGGRFVAWQGNHSRMREAPGLRDGELADGVLLDLGVSSRQLDCAERGFSFSKEGPLDMRMGPDAGPDAAEIVNTWPEARLAEMFRSLGEEPAARRIAAAIVRRRGGRSFASTTDLAACIERAVGRRGKIHPATRVFQAIRMTVNDELGSLETALAESAAALKPGGRLVVITFHSLEDRVVKRFMRRRAAEFVDDPTWAAPRPNPERIFELPRRKAILPGAEERAHNPRARSAKLRVAQLLKPAP